MIKGGKFKMEKFIAKEMMYDVYSDEKLSNMDIFRSDTNKISTILKPHIWRNEIFNLPTFDNKNILDSYYCIGVELIRGTCVPFILFKILPDKNNTMFYGYKLRSYKDISSTLLAETCLTLENKVDDKEDVVNRIVDYDKDKLDLIHHENLQVGVSNKGMPHYRRTYYFIHKDGNDSKSLFFIYENQIYSDKFDKYVLRNVGFRFIDINDHFNDIKVIRQCDTIRYYGFFIGDYEQKLLNLNPINDESVEELYK
jgi:hypothetical protein